MLTNALPTGEQIGRQFDIKLIDHPIDGLIDDVFHAFRLVIKRRHRRHDHRPHLRRLGHQPQVTQMQRRFPHAQHQTAALFEHHVGGASQQPVAVAVDDAGQRFD